MALALGSFHSGVDAYISRNILQVWSHSKATPASADGYVVQKHSLTATKQQPTAARRRRRPETGTTNDLDPALKTTGVPQEVTHDKSTGGVNVQFLFEQQGQGSQ